MSIQLSTKSTPELVAIYNERAQLLGRKTVKRFSDLKTAMRRTREIVDQTAHMEPPKKGEKGELKLEPSKRRSTRGFNFPVKQVKNLRAGTLRAAIRDRLLAGNEDGKGTTYEQLKKAVEKFDRSLGVEPYDVDIRTYEATRLLHFYCGYGMSQPEPDGPITLLTEKPATRH